MTQLIKNDLVEIIKKNAYKLTFPEVFVVDDTLEPVDKQIFLAAFSLNESSGGYNKTPLLEKAYSPGGKYFNSKQSDLFDTYGLAVCKSYSSFQMMFIIFYEIGFKPTPDNANDDSYAVDPVIKYFNKRIFKDGKANDINFLCLAGDAYNSGNWKDKNVPKEYIAKLVKNYHLSWDSGLFVPTVDRNAPKPW